MENSLLYQCVSDPASLTAKTRGRKVALRDILAFLSVLASLRLKIIPGCLLLFLLIGCRHTTTAQTDTGKWWHDKERILRYRPEGTDIVITNGNRRFTRALYGSNTAFRVETGDLPEFAMYMPGMGGNLKFGLVSRNKQKWLIDADRIVARYRAGSMIYDIQDTLLGKGKLQIIVLAMADKDGMIIRLHTENITTPVTIVWAYGGATAKRFNRDGDMGPDPESSFYLKPEYCADNRYAVYKNHFLLQYGTGDALTTANRNQEGLFASDSLQPVKGKGQLMRGVFPASSDIRLLDPAQQQTPFGLYASERSVSAAIGGKFITENKKHYFFCIGRYDSTGPVSDNSLPAIFRKAEQARQIIAGRIQVKTPDPYINTLGAALSVAADAIWEDPSYLHGSIGWRVRLNGWRGAYTGDVLGWHDRARMHFNSYAQSQLISPATGPIVADTALHLARQLEKIGTSLFSSGYISRDPKGNNLRPHHYDMNLVYIDQLLWHFRWTGDMKLVRQMWPVIQRHLAWEKRNFDPDNDGLYDAYAAIWASDALQYSGGAVTHSSAYNYRANKMSAELAKLLGENDKPYADEAARILSAMNHTLWMSDKGWYAEYKDTMGLKKLHPNAALWTVYHSLDSEVPDAFQSYQLLKYVDANIPHIPVKAKGLEAGYYTLSTSSWMPYAWSLNNVALAELMHTSLAYWQGNRKEEAFLLWKSSLLESMFMGGSAGNFQQISTYDAIRGEAYRDFADPVAMTARSLVQGLFGILPDALTQTLTIQPGLPASWDHASLTTPDIKFTFTRKSNMDVYTIVPNMPVNMQLKLLLQAKSVSVSSVTVNGKKVAWKNADSAVGFPVMEVFAGVYDKYEIKIEWNGMKPDTAGNKKIYVEGSELSVRFPNAAVQKVYDPQNLFGSFSMKGNSVLAKLNHAAANKTAFVQLKQGQFSWWQPLTITIKKPVEISAAVKQEKNTLDFTVTNHTSSVTNGRVTVNPGKGAYTKSLSIQPLSTVSMMLPHDQMVVGSNTILYTWEEAGVTHTTSQHITVWNTDHPGYTGLQTVNINSYLNAKLTDIFKNQYLSPRPVTVTMQLPTQGIGEWTHPLQTAAINDSGLRKTAGKDNRFVLPQGISFATASDTSKPNIAFTSQWDNYPRQVAIPLSGTASHAYFLMAGSTNPMQSRITNGALIIAYTDGTHDTLLLKNPETWWPIEQDYFEDGYAFHVGSARPVRVHLKTGATYSALNDPGNQYNGKMIDGGAATVLDLPLNQQKTLSQCILQTWANDVVIGLIAITLAR